MFSLVNGVNVIINTNSCEGHDALNLVLQEIDFSETINKKLIKTYLKYRIFFVIKILT